MMKQAILEEVSAGGVVYRLSEPEEGARKWEFLIGKHSGYHKWVLPKGLVEKGESLEEAAEREVAEEVGVRAQIKDFVPVKTIEYYYFADLVTTRGESATGEQSERRVKKYQEDGGAKTKVHKRVVFYLMEYEADLGGVGWEMDERKWVDYQEGERLLAFETEREVLAQARSVIEKMD